jgi:transposase
MVILSLAETDLRDWRLNESVALSPSSFDTAVHSDPDYRRPREKRTPSLRGDRFSRWGTDFHTRTLSPRRYQEYTLGIQRQGAFPMIPVNTFPPSIFLSARPVDFRKCFDGLCGEILDFMGGDPLSGALFVFYNKGRDRLKLLLWDTDGFWLLYKRLERGTFEIPIAADGTRSVTLTGEQLQLILSGIELGSVRRRKRYKKAA